MSHPPIESLLRQLGSGDSADAWNQFLADYANLIYQVAHHLEPDLDDAADCFQFVCEHLIADRARRLRKFRLEGSASFTTWLRAVVRNLCIDWHRKQVGRPRPFRFITQLSSLDQEVFRLVYERGVSAEETLVALGSTFSNITRKQVDQSVETIENHLTNQQRWILTTRAASKTIDNHASLDHADEVLARVADPRLDPEIHALFNEQQRKLSKALNNLSPQDRLLLRLRFEKDLTLQQIAQLMGLTNAQKADRLLKDVLQRMRGEMTWAEKSRACP